MTIINGFQSLTIVRRSSILIVAGGFRPDSHYRTFRLAELDFNQFEANILLIQNPANQFEW